MRKLVMFLGLVFTLNLNAQTIIEDPWTGDINAFINLVNGTNNNGGILFESNVTITSSGNSTISNACIFFESGFNGNNNTFTINDSSVFFEVEEDDINGVTFIIGNLNTGLGLEFDTNVPPCMGTLPVTIVDFSWNEYIDNINIVVTDESNIAKYKVIVFDENKVELNSFEFVGAFETPADKIRVYSIEVDISCEGMYYVELWKLEKDESDFTIVETLSFVKN